MLQVSLYTGVQKVGGASFEQEVCLLHLQVLRKVDVEACNETYLSISSAYYYMQ